MTYEKRKETDSQLIGDNAAQPEVSRNNEAVQRAAGELYDAMSAEQAQEAKPDSQGKLVSNGGK